MGGRTGPLLQHIQTHLRIDANVPNVQSLSHTYTQYNQCHTLKSDLHTYSINFTSLYKNTHTHTTLTLRVYAHSNDVNAQKQEKNILHACLYKLSTNSKEHTHSFVLLHTQSHPPAVP